MGFPFEMINSAANRNAVMARVLGFFETAISPAPGTPDLLAATDTRINNDDVTNRDNSSAAKNLQFSVPGVTQGATVTVYADGVAIGSAVAGAGGMVTITTNGTIDLADGSRAITARQLVPGQSESAASSALAVTIDTTGPTGDVVDITPDPRPDGVGSIQIVFSEPVFNLMLSDLRLERTTDPSGSNLLTSSQTLTTSDGITFTLGNLAGITATPGTYMLRIAGSITHVVTDAAGNALAGPASDTWTVTPPADAIPPSVTQVFVSSTVWQPAFYDFLDASGLGESNLQTGYRILATEQTDELPWVNLNRLSIRFSEDVVVAQDDLVVHGVNVASYGIAGFGYDAATFTATWTLTTAGVANDKLLLELDADTGTGVMDAAGNRLDGEWTNPVAPAVSGDTFPSGDGAAGGDFLFRLNVLPGDVNRSGGSVLGSDVTLVRNAQNSTPGGAGSLYTIFKDVNGSGSILGSDVTLVRNRQGLSLPAGEPSVPPAIVVQQQQQRSWSTSAVTPVATMLLTSDPLKKPVTGGVAKPV
jgi:hypothetical protein